MPQINYPVIPQTITVHLGPPSSQGENVTLPFADYIKNVASSEIYPTWPEEALRANIYAIITFALNRIYTEWYPSRGYNFDITNSTQFDQAFIKDRDIFENIGVIVDDIFNDYIVRQGSVAPIFSAFCNGTTSTCDGLSQWGTVSLAEEGYTPFRILQNYYGNDIGIVENAPIGDSGESFPGVTLRVGDAGNNVRLVQLWLERIRQNYPAIPRIARPDGIFRLDTEEAVRRFQEIFNLPSTGQVDKATWYAIKRYYTGVKGLSELASEGVSVSEATLPFANELSFGQSGIPVRTAQYYLAILAYFNGSLLPLAINGSFDAPTRAAVEVFQDLYSLPVTGVIDDVTWNEITRVYAETVAALPQGYSGPRAVLYPGYFLSEGQRSENVRLLQSYLAEIGRNIAAIPSIPVTGYYGSQTAEAVSVFQNLNGLPVSGAVGPVTWAFIAREYDALVAPSD